MATATLPNKWQQQNLESLPWRKRYIISREKNRRKNPIGDKREISAWREIGKKKMGPTRTHVCPSCLSQVDVAVDKKHARRSR